MARKDLTYRRSFATAAATFAATSVAIAILLLAAGLVVACRGGGGGGGVNPDPVEPALDDVVFGSDRAAVFTRVLTFEPGRIPEPHEDIFGLKNDFGGRLPLGSSAEYGGFGTMGGGGFPSLWGERKTTDTEPVWRINVHVKSDQRVALTWNMLLYDSFQLNSKLPEVYGQSFGNQQGTVTFPVPPAGSWTVRLVCDGWLGAWCDEIDSDGKTGRAFDAGLLKLGSASVRVVDEAGAPVVGAHVELRSTPLLPLFGLDFQEFHPRYLASEAIQGDFPPPLRGIARQLYSLRRAVTDADGYAAYRKVMRAWNHEVHVTGLGIERASDLLSAAGRGSDRMSLVVTTGRSSTISVRYLWPDGTPVNGLKVACFQEIRHAHMVTNRDLGKNRLSWDAWPPVSTTDSDGRITVNASRHLVSPWLKLKESYGPVRIPEVERLTGRFLLAARGMVVRGGKNVAVIHEQVVDLFDNASPFAKSLPDTVVEEPKLLFWLEPSEEIEQRLGFPLHVDFRRKAGPQLHSHVAEAYGTGWWFSDVEKLSIVFYREFGASELRCWASVPEDLCSFDGVRFNPAIGRGRTTRAAGDRDGAPVYRLSIDDPPRYHNGQVAVFALPTFEYPDNVRDGDFLALQYAIRTRYFRMKDEEGSARRARSRFACIEGCRADASPMFVDFWDRRPRADELKGSRYLGPAHLGVYYRWASDGRMVSWSDSEEIRAYGNDLVMPKLDTPAVALRIRLVDSRTRDEKLESLKPTNRNPAPNGMDLFLAASVPVEKSRVSVCWSPPGLDSTYEPFQEASMDGNGRAVLWGLIPGQDITVRIRSSVLLERQRMGGFRHFSYPELTFTIPAQESGAVTDWIVLDLKDGKPVDVEAK